MALAVNEQAQTALVLANEIRVRRAAERHRIEALPMKQGRQELALLVEECPDWLASVQIGRLLSWPTRTGSAAVSRLLTRARAGIGRTLSAETRLDALTPGERNVLATVVLGGSVRAVTHVCPSCGFERPYVDFALNGAEGGWIDAAGGRRRSICKACRREEYAADASGTAGMPLPVEPFAQWLEKKLARFNVEHNGGQVAFAVSVDLSERRLHEYLHRRQRIVGLTIVDRVLTREGSTNLYELYPDLYPDDEGDWADEAAA